MHLFQYYKICVSTFKLSNWVCTQKLQFCQNALSDKHMLNQMPILKGKRNYE